MKLRFFTGWRNKDEKKICTCDSEFVPCVGDAVGLYDDTYIVKRVCWECFEDEEPKYVDISLDVAEYDDYDGDDEE